MDFLLLCSFGDAVLRLSRSSYWAPFRQAFADDMVTNAYPGSWDQTKRCVWGTSWYFSTSKSFLYAISQQNWAAIGSPSFIPVSAVGLVKWPGHVSPSQAPVVTSKSALLSGNQRQLSNEAYRTDHRRGNSSVENGKALAVICRLFAGKTLCTKKVGWHPPPSWGSPHFDIEVKRAERPRARRYSEMHSPFAWPTE